MGTTVNGKDILYTIANNITQVTLTPGAAGSGGATAKGQELNAYAKAYKIITENEAYINAKNSLDVPVADVIEEIFFSHQFAGASPYTTGTGGSYGGTVATTTGVNAANGFNALFMANAIDQFRQADGETASTINDAGTTVDSFPYRLIQAQGSSAMTITLQNSAGATPTATAGVNIPFRIKSGTVAASLILGRTEYGSAVAATTLTLDSGATLGMVNNGGDVTVQSTLYIYAINNAGTINIGIINGQRLDESILHTSTVLNGSATSASTFYSDVAITDACAVRLIGRMRHSMNAVGTYDEDPIELSILGVAGGGTASGELAAGEKIFWQDTNQYIQGDLTSITIESDDTFTVHSDTLASINSTAKAEIVAPISNVVSTTTANIHTPSFYHTGNVALTSATSYLNIGSATWADGVDLLIEKQAPVFQMKTNHTSNADDAKRSRFIINSDADETMFEIDVKKEGTGASDAKSEVIFKNRGASATPAFMTVNSTQDVVFGANVSIPNLIVSGSTTTVDSTTLTVVDPMIELQTVAGGGAPASTTTKDVGLLMNYYSDAAKQAFAGWDDSVEKFIFVADATESGTQLISGTAGTIHANFTVPDAGTIGSASDADAMAIASGGAVTFSQRDIHSLGVTIADGGTIGSATDADAITIASAGAVTFSQRDIHTLGITIADGATIGTATDADAITIAAAGAVTFSQNPVFPAGGVSIASLDIDGGTDIGEAIVDADLFIIDNGAGGTNRKVAASRIKTYATTSFFGGSVGTVALPIGQGSSTADTNTGLRSSAADHLEIVAGGADRLTANTSGIHVTSLTETSYRELKENITPLEGSLDKIMALQGVNFDWKTGQENQIGLIADDVAKVAPEFVQFEQRGKKKKAVALQYSKMVALLIEGMKEQQQEINELRKLIPKS